MRGKLITSDRAQPVAKQITKPCSDCPFARASLRGWLGPLDADAWVRLAHGEGYSECHTTFIRDNGEDRPADCAGLAIYRANVVKVPRDPEALILPSDKTLVFASPAEFLAHHKRWP